SSGEGTVHVTPVTMNLAVSATATLTLDPTAVQPVSTVLLLPASSAGEPGTVVGVLQAAARLHDAALASPPSGSAAPGGPWALAPAAALPPGTSRLILFAQIEDGHWVAHPQCLPLSPLSTCVCLAPPPGLLDTQNGLD